MNKTETHLHITKLFTTRKKFAKDMGISLRAVDKMIQENRIAVIKLARDDGKPSRNGAVLIDCVKTPLKLFLKGIKEGQIIVLHIHVEELFITRNAFAKQVGVSVPTVNKMIQENKVVMFKTARDDGKPSRNGAVMISYLESAEKLARDALNAENVTNYELAIHDTAPQAR